MSTEGGPKLPTWAAEPAMFVADMLHEAFKGDTDVDLDRLAVQIVNRLLVDLQRKTDALNYSLWLHAQVPLTNTYPLRVIGQPLRGDEPYRRR